MNSAQPSSSTRDTTRESLGVVTKLVAVIIATFVFAAFSREPEKPQSNAQSAQVTSTQAANHPR